MGVKDSIMFFATLLLASQGAETAVIQAAVDVSGENSELLETILHQIEMLGHKKDGQTSLSQGLASALLQVAPVLTIRGNITDPHRRLLISFTLQASQLQPSASYDGDELDDDVDEDDDWDLYEWRGSGGVLHPIVGVVEPYLLGLAELIFSGFLSSAISNFLESATLVGDTRLV